MPGFNGTGPLGQGPMTGRGGGYCVLEMIPGTRGPTSVRGFAGLAAAPGGNALFVPPEVSGLRQWGAGPTTLSAGAYYGPYPATGSVPLIRPQAAPYGIATSYAPMFLPYHLGPFYGPAHGRRLLPVYAGGRGSGGGIRRGASGRGRRGWFGHYW